MAWGLTGIDASDPRPGILRELQVAQGDSGSGGRPRAAVMLANMATGTGSGSVDGLGDALNVARLITSRQDVIDRAGYHSEALGPGHDAFRRLNTETDLYMIFVAPGTTAATATLTFATAAAATNALRISCMGETIEVGVANGDTAIIVAAAVAAKINQQLHWPMTAAVGAPANDHIVTLTAGFAGTRGDHYLTRLRTAWSRPSAMTVTKSAVSGGGTDDDHTSAIAGLEGSEYYYHVSPKTSTSATSATDNGLGEHAAALASRYAPAGGKAEVLHFGATGTNAQAITLAVSVNYHQAFCVWAEANDYSPLMLAAQACAIQAKEEASDRGCPIFDYGPAGNGKALDVPPPFTFTDRATPTEVKAALNNGVTPIEFSPSGKSKITWQITTRSETSSVKDYRARAGHIPSVVADFWDTVRIQHSSTRQLRVSDNPAEGEKPLPGFTYPRDVEATLRNVIDAKIDGPRATLDPAKRVEMKASAAATLVSGGGAGTSAYAKLFAVKPNLKSHFLLQEVSPEI
jgi:phage tail sheath gpL-like